MLVALKLNVYPKDLLIDFIATLNIVVKYNFTNEVIRSIATFLVSSLNKRKFFSNSINFYLFLSYYY